MWDPDPGVILVLNCSPHLDRVSKDSSPCVSTQRLLSLSYPPDSGYLVKIKLKAAAVHEGTESGQDLQNKDS